MHYIGPPTSNLTFLRFKTIKLTQYFYVYTSSWPDCYSGGAGERKIAHLWQKCSLRISRHKLYSVSLDKLTSRHLVVSNMCFNCLLWFTTSTVLINWFWLQLPGPFTQPSTTGNRTRSANLVIFVNAFKKNGKMLIRPLEKIFRFIISARTDIC